MNLLLRVAVLLVIAIWTASAIAQPATEPAEQARKGQFHLSFTDQNPLSPIDAQNKRHHIKIELMQRYTLAQESFEAAVPEDYSADQPPGLLVWVSAGARGTLPKDWLPILAGHHLIGIGANNSGNERGVGVRFGLALDAVHNIKKRYQIDEARIYVAGVSGGAKVAGMLAIIYPEVFNGAIPIAGVTFYRHIPLTSDPKKMWQGSFERPPLAALDIARKQGRFVLLTGSTDFNRDSINDTFTKGFRQDGFQHVEYVEVPGQGHGVPDVQWIEQALDSLDAPLPQVAKEWFARAQTLERAKKMDDALRLYHQVEQHGEKELVAKATTAIKRLESAPKPSSR